MTLRRLEIFTIVAKHLNVTSASRELHVSQPAISQELRRLQDTFGVSFIRKSRTGIELTETGAAFQKDVEAIMLRLSALRTRYHSGSLILSEEVLGLGASHGISSSLMPYLIAEFKKSHANANISLFTNHSDELVHLLLDSKLDIAIASNPKAGSALQMEPFLSNRLCALVHAKHPLAKREAISVTELAKTPLVIRAGKGSSGRTELVLRKLRQTCGKPNIAFRCGSPEALKTAVRQGAGVGILVDDGVQDDLRKDFKILKIQGVDLETKSYILYVKKKPLSKTAEAFLTVLRAWRTKYKQ